LELPADKPDVMKLLEEKEEAFFDEQMRFLKTRWKYRIDDVEKLSSLIQSKSNIYMHGPNGSGKTSLVIDVLKSHVFDCGSIYIDSVEFYSERLISVTVSTQIQNIMWTQAQRLGLPKSI